MESFVLEWLNLLVRWLHVITGIAWIGSSFYFVWLDNHLTAPKNSADADKGVGGELWSVHGGGFYHAQKYKVAPKKLPDTLHWFKWEAYSTWLSGMFLLILMYWWGAEIYLIDPNVMDLSRGQAVALAAGVLVASFLLYEALCRSAIGRNENALSVAVLVFVAVLAWGLCQMFGGRGAYIHFGAVLGTLMVANVFVVIIPGQKKMVASAARGEAPDPMHGIRGKQRSVHNTYFTLPVIFAMTSSHYAMTYAHDWNWLILIAFAVAGALIRVYFVARHKGAASPWSLIIAALVLACAAAATIPATRSFDNSQVVTTPMILPIIRERCTVCHSAAPTLDGFAVAPAGVELDSPAQIDAVAARIHQQAVATQVMPVGNLTQMTEAERDLVDQWFQQRGGAND